MSVTTVTGVNESAMSVEEFRQIAGQVEDEVAKVIVGQSAILREVLICLIAGGTRCWRGSPASARRC